MDTEQLRVRLRSAVVSNLMDGDDGGTLSMPARKLADEVADIITETLENEMRALEVVQRIVDLTNTNHAVSFEKDWGGNSLTVVIGDFHTHVGLPEADFDQLLDELHAVVVEGGGLSFAPNPSKEST